ADKTKAQQHPRRSEVTEGARLAPLAPLIRTITTTGDRQGDQGHRQRYPPQLTQLFAVTCSGGASGPSRRCCSTILRHVSLKALSAITSAYGSSVTVSHLTTTSSWMT